MGERWLPVTGKVRKPPLSIVGIHTIPPTIKLGIADACQPYRRKKSGASGEIRTLKHLFLRQAAIPIRARWHWCTGEDLNLRVPLGETGLQPVRFGRAHAPVQTWRKADESNAHRSSRCPGFQDQLPAIQQYLPHWRRVRELNPLASCERPCLADKCLTVRPTLH